MRFRKLRIAWSVGMKCAPPLMRCCWVVALLLLTLPACRRPDEVTYLSIDGVQRSFVGGVQKLRPIDGWVFDAEAREKRIACHVHQRRTHYRFDFSAGRGKDIEIGHYEDAPRSVIEEWLPSLYIDAHGHGSAEITGWFQVHEIELSSDKKTVEHFSVDFLMIEDGGGTAFGRLRYKATIDPQPTHKQIVAAIKSKRKADDPDVDLRVAEIG